MATYLEIDMEIVRDNIQIFKNHIGKAKFMAVVKGDAYGHGMVKFAKYIEPYVDAFGVGVQKEAVALRVAGIKKPILIMCPYFDNDVVYKYTITPSIDSVDRLESYEAFLNELKVRRPYHLMLNTGMNRFGLMPSRIRAFQHRQLTCDFAYLEAIYSHFGSNMRQNPIFVRKQLKIFKETFKKISSESKPFLHMANSEVAIDLEEAHFQMVRVGNGLYGPCYSVKNIGLKKAAKLKTTVIDIRRIEKGAYVGYGATKRLKHNIMAAYIEMGFRDGFEVTRNRSGNGVKGRFKEIVKIILNRNGKSHLIQYKGSKINVIGKPNMQFIMLDISRHSQIQLGSILDVKGSTFFVDKGIERKYINIYEAEYDNEKVEEEEVITSSIDDAVAEFQEKKRRDE